MVAVWHMIVEVAMSLCVMFKVGSSWIAHPLFCFLLYCFAYGSDSLVFLRLISEHMKLKKKWKERNEQRRNYVVMTLLGFIRNTVISN